MEKLITIRTVEELKELIHYIADKDVIAFDTETTGVTKESHIIGFSICADVEVGYYVILSYWDPIKCSLVDLPTKEHAKDFLKLLVNKSLITQNGVFDAYMVENNYGVKLIDSITEDTMILAHLLDENRPCGLKELGVSLFGEDAREEQKLMKESVLKNGGQLTKLCYELYKADSELLARYGAKDAVLTLKVLHVLMPELYEQGLQDFFYKESMPLFKGPTYQMNSTGLKVDTRKLQDLKFFLEAECLELKAFVYNEITPKVKHKYKGDKPSNTFNIGASTQLAWLLFEVLGEEFTTITEGGREVCKALGLKLPYSNKQKRDFVQTLKDNEGRVYEPGVINHKTGKMGRPKKVGPYYKYTQCGKETLSKYSKRYAWVDSLLKYSKNLKLLNTYVIGIQERMQYGIVRPSFLQHGTTSGRYSSRNPNFQNLPRDDKRIKEVMISRDGKVFVGADYSQLEARVFASLSGDIRLLECFKNDEDIYSIVGMEVFEKFDCSANKSHDNAFIKLYPELRQFSKVITLSAAYGTTAHKMAQALGKSVEEAQYIIDEYFLKFPSVKKLMLDSHELTKSTGKSLSLFGRPRRIPEALTIKKRYGLTQHSELPYEIRNLLNLSVNHRSQSTGASIMNLSAIAVWQTCKELSKIDPIWKEVKIVTQCHDELILEGPESIDQEMAALLQDCMENTVSLPGVDLVAIPVIGRTMAELK